MVSTVQYIENDVIPQMMSLSWNLKFERKLNITDQHLDLVSWRASNAPIHRLVSLQCVTTRLLLIFLYFRLCKYQFAQRLNRLCNWSAIWQVTINTKKNHYEKIQRQISKQNVCLHFTLSKRFEKVWKGLKRSPQT